MGKVEFESEQFDSVIKQQGGSDPSAVDTRLGGLQVNEQTNDIVFNVIFAYDQFHQTDFVQQFSESHSLHDHLSVMFPPDGMCWNGVCACVQRQYVVVLAVSNPVLLTDWNLLHPGQSVLQQ